MAGWENHPNIDGFIQSRCTHDFKLIRNGKTLCCHCGKTKEKECQP